MLIFKTLPSIGDGEVLKEWRREKLKLVEGLEKASLKK